MPKQSLKCQLIEEVDSSLYQPKDEELLAFYCKHSWWYSEKMRYTVAQDKWVIEVFPFPKKGIVSEVGVAYNPYAKADFAYMIRGKGSQFKEILKISSTSMGRNLWDKADPCVYLDDPVVILNAHDFIMGVDSDIEYGQYPIIEVNLYSDSDDLVLDFRRKDQAFYWSLSLSPKILDLMIQNESSIEIFNPPREIKEEVF